MKYDIILAGVGGQGILTIAFLVDNAAVKRGYAFKQAEVHGMAQRGGAVYSHMRVSDGKVMSDLIPEGKADMVLSLEPLEVQRYLSYLSPDGMVVSNSMPYKNIGDYPEEANIYDALGKLKRCMLIDASIIATKCKVPMGQNIALLGAATPYLPFEVSDFEPFIAQLFERKGPDVVKNNIAALNAGYRTGLFMKSLFEKKVPMKEAFEMQTKTDPLTL